MGSVYNDKIAGRQVKGATAPTDGQALIWDSTTATWGPESLASGIAVEEGQSGVGVSVVDPATIVNFDSIYFDAQSPGGGEAFITVSSAFSGIASGLGDYLAAAGDSGEYFFIYKWQSGVLTKLAAPSSLPPAAGIAACWSPDKGFLVISHATTPFTTIYSRSADTFTKLTSPFDVVPTSQGNACAFSPLMDYLAIGVNSTPYINIYSRSGTSFTRLSNPGTLPTNIVLGVSWSPDGRFLACAHPTSPYITIYEVTAGPTFTKISDPATNPGSQAYGCAFSPDGAFLAVSTLNSPYITIYQISGTTFTKVANPATLPPSAGLGCAWSPDAQILTVAASGSPYIVNYERSGSSFTKLPDPASLPAGQCNGVSWSSDGSRVTLAVNTTPYIATYNVTGSTYTKLSNPATIPASALAGVAWTLPVGGVPVSTGGASGRSTAQTAAVSSVAALLVGSTDTSYYVSANVLVTTSTTHDFTVTVAYTDEGNTARTLTLNFSQVAGTIATNITAALGAGPYMGLPIHIRCKAATTITVATTGTFTTVTYNVEGLITQVP